MGLALCVATASSSPARMDAPQLGCWHMLYVSAVGIVRQLQLCTVYVHEQSHVHWLRYIGDNMGGHGLTE